MRFRKPEGNPQAAVFRELRFGSTTVLFRDGRGNGETDAEAAALVLAAGGVCPIESVEKAAAIHGVQGLRCCVLSSDADIASILLGKQADRVALGRVLHGVVAEDGDQPRKRGLVTIEPQIVRHG